MQQSEMKKAFQMECERLLKVETLSSEEKTQYAAGIANLEKRVEELRAVLSFTPEDFARMVAEDTRSGLTAVEVNYEKLGACLDEADEAWKRGDIDGHRLVRQKIRDLMNP